MSDDSVALCAARAPAGHAAIWHVLETKTDRALPQAACRIWARFWNGQAIGDPARQAAGKFQAAQMQCTDPSQVDAGVQRRGRKLAADEIWDPCNLLPTRKVAP